MADYAIISLGGKQYRVQEGDRLLVDRLPNAEGKTFHPDVLFTGGGGKPNLSPRVQVTAKVVGSSLGEKIRIGKDDTIFAKRDGKLEFRRSGDRRTVTVTETARSGS